MDFCGSEEGGDEASDGMMCGSRQVSMHETWKRKQIHDDARIIYRTKIIAKKFGKIVEGAS